MTQNSKRKLTEQISVVFQLRMSKGCVCCVADMVASRATERKLDAGASIISDVHETSQDFPPFYVHGGLWRCYTEAHVALLQNPRLEQYKFCLFGFFYANKKEVP